MNMGNMSPDAEGHGRGRGRRRAGRRRHRRRHPGRRGGRPAGRRRRLRLVQAHAGQEDGHGTRHDGLGRAGEPDAATTSSSSTFRATSPSTPAAPTSSPTCGPSWTSSPAACPASPTPRCASSATPTTPARDAVNDPLSVQRAQAAKAVPGGARRRPEPDRDRRARRARADRRQQHAKPAGRATAGWKSSWASRPTSRAR